MPQYCFICPEGKEVAGCVERICCESPFVAPRIDPRTRQQMINPQNGQPVMGPNSQATWQWLMGAGYAFPPGIGFKCLIINPAYNPQTRAPYVFCVQTTAPAVQRAQINAPYANPVSNPGVQSAPPMPGQGRVGPAGAYEVIPDAGLPGSNDPMLGDIDGQGGTYTDLDGQGNEIPRDNLLRQAAPPIQQR